MGKKRAVAAREDERRVVTFKGVVDPGDPRVPGDIDTPEVSLSEQKEEAPPPRPAVYALPPPPRIDRQQTHKRQQPQPGKDGFPLRRGGSSVVSSASSASILSSRSTADAHVLMQSFLHLFSTAAPETPVYDVAEAMVYRRLTEGGVFWKFHEGGKGAYRMVWCSPDLQRLFWGDLPRPDTPRASQSGHDVLVSDVRAVHAGWASPNSKAFKKRVEKKRQRAEEKRDAAAAAAKEEEGRCLSLQMAKRSLDLACIANWERDMWVRCFEHLLKARRRMRERLAPVDEDEHVGGLPPAPAGAGAAAAPSLVGSESDESLLRGTANRFRAADRVPGGDPQAMSRESLVEEVMLLRNEVASSVPKAEVRRLKQNVTALQRRWLDMVNRDKLVLLRELTLIRDGPKAAAKLEDRGEEWEYRLDGFFEDDEDGGDGGDDEEGVGSASAAGGDRVRSPARRGHEDNLKRLERSLYTSRSLMGGAGAGRAGAGLAGDSPGGSPALHGASGAAVPPPASLAPAAVALKEALADTRRALEERTRDCSALQFQAERVREDMTEMRRVLGITIASLAMPSAGLAHVRSEEEMDAERRDASGYLERNLRKVTKGSVAHLGVGELLDQYRAEVLGHTFDPAAVPRDAHHPASPDEEKHSGFVGGGTPTHAAAGAGPRRNSRALAIAVPRESGGTVATGAQDERLLSVFLALRSQWEMAELLLSEGPDARLPKWVPDAEAPRCSVCDTGFTAVRRRHHCRLCGSVVCGACSPKKCDIARFGLRGVRVCSTCHLVLRSVSAGGKAKGASAAAANGAVVMY